MTRRPTEIRRHDKGTVVYDAGCRIKSGLGQDSELQDNPVVGNRRYQTTPPNETVHRPVMKTFSETSIRRLFRISLVFKGVFSVLEIVGGLLAYFISQRFLVNFVTAVTQEELTEDPRDFIAHYLVESVGQLSVSSQHFAALYLLSHGIIKTWLIVGLLRNKLWYYPIAMIVFILFVAYQLFRFQITYSIWLLAITAVDAVVIGLTWHEYWYLRRLYKKLHKV